MSESMVERVARALYEQRGGKRHALDELFPSHRLSLLQEARAAIAALREPNLNVLAEGHDAMFEGKWDASQAPMMGAAFDAMIDAALSDPTDQVEF